jgi:chromosome segregation ATPase
LASDNDSAQLRAELMASQSGRMLAAAQVRQCEAERVYLRNELDRAEHTLAEYARVQKELRADLESLKIEAESLRNSLATEQAIRRSLETSRSWRWTRPLRDFLNANKGRS